MQKISNIDGIFDYIKDIQLKSNVLIFDAHNLVYRMIHSAAYEFEKTDKRYYMGQEEKTWTKTEYYGYWKHLVISSIFSVIKDRRPDKVILAFDGDNTWRKEIYSDYKSSRKLKRKKSKVDFDEFFPILNEFINELRIIFSNFYVLRIDTCEADDVVAILTKYFLKSEDVSVELISTDSDFTQLQIYQNFKQYNPTTMKYMKSVNPLMDLQVKIISGDNSDDIPGIKNRCGPKTAMKILNEGLDSHLEDEDTKKKYVLNTKLIDFEYIPKQISDKIVDCYCKYETAQLKPNVVSDWFIKNGLNDLEKKWQSDSTTIKKI